MGLHQVHFDRAPLKAVQLEDTVIVITGLELDSLPLLSMTLMPLPYFSSTLEELC